MILSLPLMAGLPPSLAYGLSLAVSILWILFFTNGFNFMDGMDGFAASFARMAAWFMFAIVLAFDWMGAMGQIGAEALLLPILAIACAGFLYWNRPPARVFMGDGGSLSLGYLLSVYVLLGQKKDALGVYLPLASSLTVLLPFIFDVTLTLIRRARLGQNLLKAHREHLYQRLMRLGLSHHEVLKINRIRFLLCGVAALAGALSGSGFGRVAGLAVAFFVMVDYWRRTLARERGG